MSEFDKLEVYAATLKRVAGSYDEKSEEYHTIALASKALIYAVTEHTITFHSFLAACNEELSEEQRKHLRNIGIDGL